MATGFTPAQFNPCCCISLKSGATILAVFEIVYGTMYIFRFAYIEHLRNDRPEFFPDDIPNPTKSDFMHFMFRRGNYATMILSGSLLLLAIQYLRKKFHLLTGICYIWMITRLFLIISLIIFCNALLNSKVTHLKRYGIEVLFGIFISFYFLIVVSVFLQDTRVELNSTRAIKPINIIEGEHEGYLLRDKNSYFDNATSFQTLSPIYFLNSKYIKEADLAVDPSQLQYTVAKTKVQVIDEKKALREMDRISKEIQALSMSRRVSLKAVSDISIQTIGAEIEPVRGTEEKRKSRKSKRLSIIPTFAQSRRQSPAGAARRSLAASAPRTSMGFRQLIINKEVNERGADSPASASPKIATDRVQKLTFQDDAAPKQ